MVREEVTEVVREVKKKVVRKVLIKIRVENGEIDHLGAPIRCGQRSG